jgi:hypothetical protein
MQYIWHHLKIRLAVWGWTQGFLTYTWNLLSEDIYYKRFKKQNKQKTQVMVLAHSEINQLWKLPSQLQKASVWHQVRISGACPVMNPLPPPESHSTGDKMVGFNFPFWIPIKVSHHLLTNALCFLFIRKGHGPYSKYLMTMRQRHWANRTISDAGAASRGTHAVELWEKS